MVIVVWQASEQRALQAEEKAAALENRLRVTQPPLIPDTLQAGARELPAAGATTTAAPQNDALSSSPSARAANPRSESAEGDGTRDGLQHRQPSDAVGEIAQVSELAQVEIVQLERENSCSLQ